jgi:predicted dehydrogenase
MEAFVAALAEGRPMSPDFADGVEALRLAVAAGESLRSGRAVDVGV